MNNEFSLEKYEEFVLRMGQRNGEDQPWQDAMGNAALGLSGEAGEVADLVKKVLYHGKEVGAETFEKELGDVLWYITYFSRRLLNKSIHQIAATNMAKLQARYPSGGFTEAEANAPRDGAAA